MVMKDVTSRDEVTVQLLQSDFFGHSHDRSRIVLTFLGDLSRRYILALAQYMRSWLPGK